MLGLTRNRGRPSEQARRRAAERHKEESAKGTNSGSPKAIPHRADLEPGTPSFAMDNVEQRLMIGKPYSEHAPASKQRAPKTTFDQMVGKSPKQQWLQSIEPSPAQRSLEGLAVNKTLRSAFLGRRQPVPNYSYPLDRNYNVGDEYDYAKADDDRFRAGAKFQHVDQQEWAYPRSDPEPATENARFSLPSFAQYR